MSLPKVIVDRFPAPMLEFLVRWAGFLRFAVVGGITFVLTTVLFFVLKLTALHGKPVTAFVIATLVATVVSYVLNREWSFSDRGGRQTRHEAALFFLVSAIALGVTQIPLAVSSYIFDLRVPHVSQSAENLADFISGSVLGTLLATAFRWWAFRRWVFPELRDQPTDRPDDVVTDVRDR
ncbi:GtrA family protein [Williamsia sterculiae]|uniref:Putative flippase GtrA (Transmembrane translocase of bactoprenol-linked glucose) n=1 Tax=Williamsia sterculiae TaxID=1344003 RepID=A0A1N7F1A5_9NOCA|nr:GtrA family protein [Williamsia sterculiae]SIR94148.1 Putative flippase GtrA (transmembrane translocase of bactoprenol-linked glucose) [Williamsia sterculiae]